MTLAFKDASDFLGRTVPQNLFNQVSNMNSYAHERDINVSNHANAFNKKATGFEVWYYAGDMIGKELAEKVAKAGANALGIVNRGAKPTTNLYVITQSVGHTILTEWFFIDNPNDVAKWKANKNKAIAAVMKVFESYPEYNFVTTHGGHYGFDMMDPGACGNGLKEAVVMQEVNKAMLIYNPGSHIKPKPDTSKYWDKRGWYEMLTDDTFYADLDFKEPSGWKMAKGSEIYIDQVIQHGNVYRGAVQLGNVIRYITLNKKYIKKK